jgi:hypothetical protein
MVVAQAADAERQVEENTKRDAGCMSIANDADRLACYDTVKSPSQPLTETEIATISKWADEFSDAPRQPPNIGRQTPLGGGT